MDNCGQRAGGVVTRGGASVLIGTSWYHGDAGIHQEGHRASSKAKPCRDATFVPRSGERSTCLCRGQIEPESDGAGSDEQALIGKGKRPTSKPNSSKISATPSSARSPSSCALWRRAAAAPRATGSRRCWPRPYCTRRPGPCAAAPVRAPASRNLCAVNGRRRGGGAAQRDGAE